MKQIKFIPNAFVGISLVSGLASCQNDLEPEVPNPVEAQVESTPLGEVLSNVVTSHNNETDGDSYIIYDASANDFTVMTAEEYALINSFVDVLAPETSPATRAPQGNGWKVGGSGKGRSGAMKLAMKLAKELEANRDFEIHIEYGDDGSFTVWYRYV
jgi:hypothetical protein